MSEDFIKQMEDLKSQINIAQAQIVVGKQVVGEQADAIITLRTHVMLHQQAHQQAQKLFEQTNAALEIEKKKVEALTLELEEIKKPVPVEEPAEDKQQAAAELQEQIDIDGQEQPLESEDVDAA